MFIKRSTYEALVTEKESAELSVKSINRKHMQEVVDLESKVAKLEKRLSDANKTIRKQTGADLLVNALEAIGVLKVEPPKSIDSNRNRGQDLMRAYDAACSGDYNQHSSMYNGQCISGLQDGFFGTYLNW